MPHKSSEVAQKYFHDYYQRNKEQYRISRRVYDRKYRLQKPDKRRIIQWRSRGIDITPEGRAILFQNQDGRCAVCRRPERFFKVRLAVDHNHKTGEVRGLLCSRCNRHVVALLEHEPDLILAAQRYLNARRSPETVEPQSVGVSSIA